MNPQFFQKLRYRFDNSLSKGSLSIIGWVALFIVLIVISFATVVTILDFVFVGEEDESGSFIQRLHDGFWQLLAPGPGEWDSKPYLTFFMVLLGIIGILIASVLIGLISSSIEDKIEDLRRGRSPILEKNHIVIYGWTSKIFLVVTELIAANENQANNKICILGSGDKVEMENEIREKIEDLKSTEIIVRSGEVTDIDDLNIMNPQEAKSIIILPPDESEDHSEMDIIKTLLAILNSPYRKKGKYNIVTEINDPSIIKVAQIIGDEEITLIQTDDIIARIMVQTCRQVGLSIVYNELLAFEDNEIYFRKDPSLAGKNFRDIIGLYIEAAPLGIFTADGKILLNPNFDTTIQADDAIICIATDDSDSHFQKDFDQAKRVNSNVIYTGERTIQKTENTLVIGWNDKAYRLINELNNYVAPGSSLMILSKDQETKEAIDEIAGDYKNLSISVKIGSTTSFDFLASIPVELFDHVILLSYDNIDAKKADSYTLVSLIQLREIGTERNAKFNVVSEMLDIRNRALAELAKPDDFIISTNITSLLLAQLSENSKLKGLFEELFSAAGAEIYLKPITDYIKTEEAISYSTLVQAAIQRNEIVFGYRKATLGKSIADNFGIVINPNKNTTIQFDKEDTVIIVSDC